MYKLMHICNKLLKWKCVLKINRIPSKFSSENMPTVHCPNTTCNKLLITITPVKVLLFHSTIKSLPFNARKNVLVKVNYCCKQKPINHEPAWHTCANDVIIDDDKGKQLFVRANRRCKKLNSMPFLIYTHTIKRFTKLF